MKLLETEILRDANTHGDHAEDLLLMGKTACEVMVDALEDTIENIQQEGSHHITTVKVDGAPAAFCASDYKGKCFIATKGIFNNTPIYAETDEDCDRIWGDKSPDFLHKMKTLLKWIPLLNIPKNEMWQGDFLFTKEDLEVKELDGERCITFQPNTIMYAVPLSDPIVTKISRADCGIVWHTRYILNDAGVRNKSFKIDASILDSVPAVFSIDANIPNYSGRLSLNTEEIIKAENNIKEIKRLIPSFLNDPDYLSLTTDKKILPLLKEFKNYMVRKDKQYLYANDLNNLIAFRWLKFKRKIEKKPYADEKRFNKGKAIIEEEIERLKRYKDLIILYWTIQNYVVEIKEIFLTYLNKKTKMRSYLKTKNGDFLRTNGEGFVISDQVGNAQKWVSRLEFSKANFSGDFIKGWSSDKRKNEELFESLAFKNFLSKLSEDVLEDIQDTLEPIFDQVGVENKKEVEPIGSKKNPKGARYVLMPSKDSEDKREVKADKTEEILKKDPSVDADSVFLYYGGDYHTTPIITATMDTPSKEDAEIKLTFKPNIYSGTGDALSTEADEVYWAYCMSLYNIRNFAEFPTYETDFDEVNLTNLGLREDQKPKNSNRNGYIEGTKALLGNNDYLDSNDLYAFNREGTTIVGGMLENNRKSIHNMINDGAVRIMGKGSKKDSWNPADLVAYKVSEYNNIINELNDLNKQTKNINDGQNGFKNYNEFLNKRLADKSLVCISLKDIRTGNSSIEIIPQNINGENLEKYQFNNCNIINIKVPALLLRSESNRLFGKKRGKVAGISVEVQNNTSTNESSIVDIDYRQSGATNLNIEAKERNSNARLGKTPKFIFNNLLKNILQDASAKELSKEDVYEILFKKKNLNETLLKIRAINNSGINLIYPGNIDEYSLTEENWVNFLNRISILKDQKNNQSKEYNNYGIPMDVMISDETSEETMTDNDISTLYIWPRIIDFIYLLICNPERTSFILKSILQGASKTYAGCPPFIKIC